MGRICPKANSTVCSKFQMVPINSIPKLVLEINSDPPCCTSQWLPCSEALVVLAMSSIDYSWRKRRVVSSLQLILQIQNQRRSRNSQMPTIPSHPLLASATYSLSPDNAKAVGLSKRLALVPGLGWIWRDRWWANCRRWAPGRSICASDLSVEHMKCAFKLMNSW